MVKSKTFIITKPGEFVFKDLTFPSVEAKEVLIKVKACGICTTDRRIYKGIVSVPFPVIGGHEVSGEVVEVGNQIKDIEVGTKVAVDTINRCGYCYYCIRRWDNLCLNSRDSSKINGIYLIAGGFSEYLIAQRKQVFPIAKGVNLKEAALSEPLSCCISSVKKASLSMGDTVLIIGAGTMGILNAMIARLKGVNVLLSDTNLERREFAEKLGFIAIEVSKVSEVANKINDGLGFDAVIITAPALEVVNEALEYIRKRGTIILYSSIHPNKNMAIDWNKLHYSEAIITGTEGRTMEDFREATALISNSLVDLNSLITKTISIEEIPEELSLMPEGQNQRTIVTF